MYSLLEVLLNICNRLLLIRRPFNWADINNEIIQHILVITNTVNTNIGSVFLKNFLILSDTC